MPQSLSHVLVHLVFSTKVRRPWLSKELRPRIFAYLAEVIRSHKTDCFRVGGYEDHVHIALDLPRSVSIADVVRSAKANSSRWISGELGIEDFA